MKLILIISILILGQVHPIFGQLDQAEIIDLKSFEIDNDSTLKLKEYDEGELYNQELDRRRINILYDESGLKKIEEIINIPSGRIKTIIYFQNEQPIKIIDTEEVFKQIKDPLSWDNFNLDQIFQADIYIMNWELDQGEIIKKGKRKFSEGTCAIFEYEPLIELGRELMDKKK